MRRWYTEIPALRAAYPDMQVLSCHDEYLLPTMFDVDGLLVGYGNIAPELLVDLIEAGKARDYAAAHAIHERLLPVTKAVYHRGSHMEGTVALKWGWSTVASWITPPCASPCCPFRRAPTPRSPPPSPRPTSEAWSSRPDRTGRPSRTAAPHEPAFVNDDGRNDP